MPIVKRMVVALALLVISTACQRQAAELTQTDKDGVRAEIEKYRQAALAADWNAWGNTLAADVFGSPANVAPMTSREAAVAWVKSFPKITELDLKIDEIIGRDDLAFVRGTYTLGLALPNGSSNIDRGAFFGIHRRQSDGRWPHTHMMFHSTEPLPAAPSAGSK